MPSINALRRALTATRFTPEDDATDLDALHALSERLRTQSLYDHAADLDKHLRIALDRMFGSRDWELEKLGDPSRFLCVVHNGLRDRIETYTLDGKPLLRVTTDTRAFGRFGFTYEVLT